MIVIITLVIIFVLFMVQRFGTDIVGKAFGPIMFAWFTFLGVMGLMNFSQDWTVIRALNPYYAIQLLFSADNKLGLFILGNIFLATTGAEALYSDLGHVGKRNIRLSWPYVKICLVINYFGQAAWLLNVYQNPEAQQIKNLNPFFQMMPQSWIVIGVAFATVAAVIASQALITGSFTLVSEAIKLRTAASVKDHVSWEQYRANVYPSSQSDFMDRLFSSGCHIPNVSSYGSCLRSIDHCDDVDDNSTALLLSYPKWAFSLACIFSYLFLRCDRSRFLYLKCCQILPRRFCSRSDWFDHLSRDVYLGTREHYSRIVNRGCVFERLYPAA